MRQKLKRSLALLLCALMLSSECTGLFTAAQAAPAAPVDQDSAPSAASALALTTPGGSPLQYEADENGRPNLFVHFLGDNYNYIYNKTGVNAGTQPDMLPVPAPYDQSKGTNPDVDSGDPTNDAPGNTWNRYRGAQDTSTAVSPKSVIFWVGLGIDRREVFELLESGQGLTSLEAGFYYDSRYIEPYVDLAKGDYKATIQAANIANRDYPANTQWSADYEILRAETDMDPATDAITQEEVVYPSFTQIVENDEDNWKMTYVSLELKDPMSPTADRRLAGAYKGVDGIDQDEDGNPITPPSAHGTGMQNAGGDPAKNDYQYLLLIPFRLKRYGNPEQLALRLARNATHLSIGAGQEGESAYAAWERVTTRNPGKDLKLLTRFNGDLFLFGDPTHNGEVEYTATLHLDLKNQLNRAELSVDGDPAVWPVKATRDQDVIRGLRSGLGMKILAEPQSGYTVTVRVDYKNAAGETVLHTYQTVRPNAEYTFVMPQMPGVLNKNVDVWIGFSTENPEYYVYLSELHRDENGDPEDRKLGNSATITTNLDGAGNDTDSTQVIHSYSLPYDSHPTHPDGFRLEPHEPGPRARADANKKVRIDVTTHDDYMAVVRIGNFDTTGSLTTTSFDLDAEGDARVETDPASRDYGKITLPYGGTITLYMPGNDVDVEVTYLPAPRYAATLEVYHDPDNSDTISDMNTAQLAYLVFDESNLSSTAYSGVVYNAWDESAHTQDHRAVKTGMRNQRLPWVATSQAALSAGMAPDTGRSGMTWNPNGLATPLDPVRGLYTVMTRLRSAADLTDFVPDLSALDLNSQQVIPGWTGLRKDLQGQSYGDDAASSADVAQLRSYLWELRTRIENDPTLISLYDKSVTQTVGGSTSTVYRYYDLTAAQVQSYVLDILEAQEIDRINRRQYATAYLTYQELYALWAEQDAKPALTGQVTPPEFPTEPGGLTEADAQGVRWYQGEDYQNSYLADYDDYADSYRAYIAQVAATGRTDVTGPNAAPTVPAKSAIPLRTDAEAKTQLQSYEFKTSEVGTSASITTREKRTVWVAAEGDSAYRVKSVELYNVDSDGHATSLIATVAKPDNGYANLWSFEMPQRNCVVRVTYERRTTRNLMVQIVDADGQENNETSVEAYRPADHDTVHYPSEMPAVAPKLGVISNRDPASKNVTPYPPAPAPGQPDERYIYNVFLDGTVTIRVKTQAGYSTEVKITNVLRGDDILPTRVPAEDPADGEIYTFKVTDTGVNEDWIRVTVTYIQHREQYAAHIRYYTLPNSDMDPDNDALWRLENPGSTPSVTYASDIPDVYVGTPLVGDVTVRPGYYIYGVVARGASGGYPYVLSGNGYNNGFGTAVSGTEQPVKINVEMPAEELWVEVYFKKVTDAAPPSQPDYPLSLTVKDEDNTDAAHYADNYATATVYDLDGSGDPDLSATLDTLGPVGRRESSMVDYGFVPRGKWVKVDFHADTGYYVSKVTVGPSSLGVALIWESESSASFYMPAGATGICVEFAKGDQQDRPAYYLTVRESWDGDAWDAGDYAAQPDISAVMRANYVTTADSDTIRSWYYQPISLRPETNPERVPGASASQNARGAAVSGEEVTMTYVVDDSDWYVQSIILFSDGAATRLTDYVQEISNVNGQKTCQVKFHMPSGDAEFVVHYRRADSAGEEYQEYPLTVVLYDSDNTADTKDDNRLSATFHGAVGEGLHANVELGLALPTPKTNDMRYIHPGDVVTLTTQVQPGYTVDYLIIDPASLGLYPSWQSVTTDAGGVTRSVATFTMPSQGVAVVARYVKSDAPRRYTANLILHPPAGCTIAQAGKGTFAAPTGGSLTAYPTQAVYATSQAPGTAVDYDLYANDGFRIARITIEPAVGATGSLSGGFGYQSGGFTMPAANVNVNVWFERGWPDDDPDPDNPGSRYDLTLEVHGAAQRADEYAAFRSAGSNAFTSPDSDPVHDGERRTIPNAAYDGQTVVVDVHADDDHYYNAGSVSVTDSQGNAIDWWYVPGGIAFTMPPRTTTVVITFKEKPDHDDPDGWRSYSAKLVVLNGNATDTAKLDTTSATAAGNPVTYAGTDGTVGTITQLYPQDALTLTLQPGANRHIAAAYAVCDGTGVSIPIYADGALAAPPTLAQLTPGDPASPVVGQLTMPESDVTVYVRYAAGAARPDDQRVTLWVSGPAPAGYAVAEIDEGIARQTLTVTTPGGRSAFTAPALAVEGMDTRYATQGRPVTVTFEPAAGYDITRLEVYDRYGNPVPYQWVSVVQDPPALSDPSMWPAPPTDPSPGIGHPSWQANSKKQITLTVPTDSVTVHVTYGAVDRERVYTAQIVVNDPNPASPSRNNAWFGPLDDPLQARLRTARAGEWIDMSLTVHPGYRVEYIKLSPQSYGIAPALPLGDIYDQNTGFYMPSGDCVIYVRYTRDLTELKRATVMALGAPTGNAANYATIHSPISGVSPHATVNGLAQSVQARPTVDWLTVDYYWAAANSIASITVQTQDGAALPYTQNEDVAARHGQIVLPMAARDVVITVVYQVSPDPVGQEVVLHVIDKDANPAAPILGKPVPDGEMKNYGRLVAVYAVGADTGLIGPDSPPAETAYEGVSTIWVPAGERVDLTACSDWDNLDGRGRVYIESAFVLYEEGGQMLNMNLRPDSPGPGFSGRNGPKESSFVVHQGRNDVYVTLTRTVPTQTEYSAVLMLKGPADDAAQAGICVGSSYTAAAGRRDELLEANHGYAYVTATRGEQITINVVPAVGYAIDHIQVTPLGYPLNYTYRITDSVITFDMPHCNVAITVYLKKAITDTYQLTLHYVKGSDTVQPGDYGRVSWTRDDGTPDTIWAWAGSASAEPQPGVSGVNWTDTSSTTVRAGAAVTLWATLDDPDVILAAYVLSQGDLVPLTPTYPADRTQATGLEGLGESASAGDNGQADALATFDMPNADAHVYLVTTDKAPYENWHTVVLTARDYSPSGNNNTGQSEGYLNEEGRAADQRQTVWSYGDDNLALSHTYMVLPEYDDAGLAKYFTVDTKAAPGYELSIGETHLSKNTPVYVQPLSPQSISPTVSYRVPVGNCNKAVQLVFKSQADLDLTVEIDDPDNPGNGTVTNAVDAFTPGLTPLHLQSQSMAGSYQIMSGVTVGAPVDLSVTPHAGYEAHAFLYTGDSVQQVPLTASGGVLTGSFSMPASAARVVVTFFLPYQGTLVLVDNANANARAQMTESTGTAPDTVSVNALLSPSGTLTKLPNGTQLDAHMVEFAAAGRKVTGLLTRKGSTTLLPAQDESGVDHYRHTIDRADATITLVVDEDGATGEEYIAAVETVNKPSEVAAPTINDQTNPTKAKGDVWTSADQSDSIQVHVTVPDGYTVRVTAKRTDNGSAVTLSGVGGDGSLAATGNATFPMPAADVQVTVEYLRTHHRLTLHIADTSGVPGNTTQLTPAATLAAPTVLTADGESTYVAAGQTVDLSATPAAGAKLKRVFYQIAGESTVHFVTLTSTASFSGLLQAMPTADMDVTVVYAADRAPTPPPDPDPDDYFIATAVKVDSANHPDNQILSIRNLTRTTLLNSAAPLPAASPSWTAGYANDGVQVSYQAAPGYYVSVTAKAADGTPVLPVLQMGASALGTGTTAFPAVGEDIVITVTYTTVPPDSEVRDVALQLVEHEAQADNKAQTTDFTSPATLVGLALNGTHLDHADPYADGVISPDPVEIVQTGSSTGHDLRTLANWAANFQVVRMTLAVRNTDSGAETGEVELPVSWYGPNATSRCPVPPLQANEIPVIRVYYGSIYDATLHVVGASVPYDVTQATDDRATPVTSTGGAYITNTGEKLEQFRGDGTETVQTTAIPDTLGVGGSPKRLVGVVYESTLTGARATQSTGSDRYDFTMPADDVDFYVIYEREPTDPKDRSYIAKVALDASSAPIAGTQNALTIRNANNAAAARGKYWVTAKGGDSVTVNVKVAPGYQAQIVSTRTDDQSPAVLNQLPQIYDDDLHTTRPVQSTDPFQYDISRTQFVYNLPAGKDATFTMPAGTDATVTVRFVKGYDLSLSVTDDAGGANQAELTYDGTDHLHWSADSGYDPTLPVLTGREGDKDVTTHLTLGGGIRAKVTRTTPFTGTVTLTDDTSDYLFRMPQENTAVHVLLQDEDAQDNLLAKVELMGDYTDLNGNTATPVVDDTTPSPLTQTGTVWTTTAEGNQIDLTLTVRSGYEARVRVRRDNQNYYDNPIDPSKWDYLDAWRYQFTKRVTTSTAGPTDALLAADPSAPEAGITEVLIGYGQDYQLPSTFPDVVSGQQHFRFRMPTNTAASGSPGDPGYVMGDEATDVTILVTFERATEMPRPFDPDDPAMDNIDLERGFIYGENRGDYAIIEIPTLAKTDGETGVELFDTDNYAAPAAANPMIHDPGKTLDTEVTRYIFALYDASADQYTELEEGTDVVLLPADAEALADPADLYNYILGLYHGGTTLDSAVGARDFVGSKFLLLPKPQSDGTFTSGGQALYEMLNNKGSLACQADGTPVQNADGKYYTTLYVMAEDAAKRQSGYTQVWIRPWFALGVNVISYAPTHDLTGELYRLMTQEELDQVKGVAAPSTSQALLPADDFANYQYNTKQAPFLTDSIVLENDAGSGKWLQVLRIRSSELLGGFTADYDPGAADLLDNVPADANLTYALAVRKAANLTYRRVNLELNPNRYTGGAELADYYLNGEPATRTFMIQDTIQLIAGDVDGNRMVKLQDYDLVYNYVYRNRPWNTVPTAPVQPSTPQSGPSQEWDDYYAAKGEWSISVYNPASTAYRVDLDGDRRLTVADLDIVRTLYNYNRAEADYQWRQVNSAGKGIALVLPFGLGPRPSDHMLLLGLPLEGEMPADPYWDQSADLDSQEAEALDTLWVDRDGNLWQGAADPEDGDAADTAERPAQPQPQPGERVEIPLGGDRQGQAGQPQGGREVFWEPAFPAEDMTPSPEPTDETPEADPEDEAAPEDPLPEREAEPESEAEAQPETPPSEADAAPETPPSEPEATPETPLSQAVPDSAPEP